MAIELFHKTETGDGLEFVGGKYQVKAGTGVRVDGSGVHCTISADVQSPLEKTDSGVIKLKDGTVVDFRMDEANRQIVATLADGSTKNVPLPALPVDVKISGLTFADGKLKATLSDGTSVETDFNAEIVVKAIEAADDAQKRRIIAAIKPLLLAELRGEEVQNSSGESKGFLLPTA